jgi:hypothetical protein
LATSDENYYYFRYTVTLLRYAEADNEAVGQNGSIYEVINQVRGRVGLRDLRLSLTQRQIRTAIHRSAAWNLPFKAKDAGI